MQGAVGFLITSLLQIFQGIFRRKNITRYDLTYLLPSDCDLTFGPPWTCIILLDEMSDVTLHKGYSLVRVNVAHSSSVRER